MLANAVRSFNRLNGPISVDQLEETLGAEDASDGLDCDVVVQILDQSVRPLSTDLEVKIPELRPRESIANLHRVDDGLDVIEEPSWVVAKLLEPLRRCGA